MLCVFFFSLFPLCFINSFCDFLLLLPDFQPHLLATAGLWVCNIWNECRCWPCTGETKWYNRRGTQNRGAFIFLFFLTSCPTLLLLLPSSPWLSFLSLPAWCFLQYPSLSCFPTYISSLPPACCTLNAACRTLIRKCMWQRKRQLYLCESVAVLFDKYI